MAKDNVPFHSVMFPATLIAVDKGYKLVDNIMATGKEKFEHYSVGFKVEKDGAAQNFFLDTQLLPPSIMGRVIKRTVMLNINRSSSR